MRGSGREQVSRERLLQLRHRKRIAPTVQELLERDLPGVPQGCPALAEQGVLPRLGCESNHFVNVKVPETGPPMLRARRGTMGMQRTGIAMHERPRLACTEHKMGPPFV